MSTDPIIDRELDDAPDGVPLASSHPVEAVDPTIVATAAIRAALAERAGGAPLPDDAIATLGSWSALVMAALRAGGTLLTFGNGGSAADAEHLAAELVGRYDRDRRPLAAAALTANTAAVTAIANDYGFEQVFARQVHALATPLDVVLGISTSGRSSNVLAGLAAAGDVGAHRLALIGGSVPPESIEALERVTESTLAVAPRLTPGIQEAHRLAWHLLCVGIDATLDAPSGAAVSPSRVVPIAEAMARIDGWRAAGHRIATTNGCFDLLHEGHIAALDEARLQADHLVVLCNTDASVARSKGPSRPAIPFGQRAAVLGGLRSIDLVVALDDDVPTALLDRIRPDVHVKGAEYELDQLPEAATVIAHGGRIHRNAMVADRSSTQMITGIERP